MKLLKMNIENEQRQDSEYVHLGSNTVSFNTFWQLPHPYIVWRDLRRGKRCGWC